MNIDAFLASVEAGIAQLNHVTDKAQTIMSVRIERVLKRIKSTSLIEISEEKTYTLGGGGIETFIADQRQIIKERATVVSNDVRCAEEALEELVALVPAPYAFHTEDNHYERDLKIRLGFLAYQAVCACMC